jgi:hypothetical protein
VVERRIPNWYIKLKSGIYLQCSDVVVAIQELLYLDVAISGCPASNQRGCRSATISLARLAPICHISVPRPYRTSPIWIRLNLRGRESVDPGRHLNGWSTTRATCIRNYRGLIVYFLPYILYIYDYCVEIQGIERQQRQCLLN